MCNRSRQPLVKLKAAAADAGDGSLAGAETEEGSTFFQAVLNVMNILMGVGLLSIPYALGKSGWLGLVVLAFLGVMTNYSGKDTSGQCAPHCAALRTYQRPRV